MFRNSLKAVFSATLMLALVSGFSGCKGQQQQMIDHVTYKPAVDFKSVRVSLVFSKNIQTNLLGVFNLKDWGYLFINPWQAEQPFEIGFELGLGAMTDNEYLEIKPTDTLPNGIPLANGYPLAEIKSPTPISDSFDLYGYVDVTQGKWLGVATLFKFIDQNTFPQGLSISQVFMQNAEGKAGILGSVFGPTLNADGTVKRHGGISMLANVRQLIEQNTLRGGEETSFYPVDGVTLAGPEAAKYTSAKKLKKIQKKLIRAFNSAR